MGAILDEAHKFNVPVAVHNVKQVDAKEMVRGGWKAGCMFRCARARSRTTRWSPW